MLSRTRKLPVAGLAVAGLGAALKPDGDTVDVRLDEDLRVVVMEGDSEGSEESGG